MKRTPRAMLILLLCLAPIIAASPALAADAAGQAETVHFGLGAGLEQMGGNTLYHISFFDPTAGQGGESELKFPLQTTLVGIEGSLTGKDAKRREIYSVSFQWFRNIGNGSGQLQDSDWLNNALDVATVGQVHPGLDIYSTSDISLRATMVDLRASYSVWEKTSERVAIGPLAGFLYEHFSYDASNLNQVGYGPYAALYTATVAGTVLTYEVTYKIPYVGLHLEGLPSEELRLGMDLGYSPFVSAEDRDNHVLRGKLSEGSTTGTAYFASVGLAWSFTGADSVLLNGQYLKIRTTGTQTQSWYRNDGSIPAGTTISGINDRIDSEQTTYGLILSHRF